MCRLALGLVVAFLTISMAGCGSRKVDVTGRVTYNGAPLAKPGGKIIFVGPDDTQTVASIELDGAYRAAGVSAGMNKVAVFYPNPEFKTGKVLPGHKKHGEPPPVLAAPFLTPPDYASAENSGISVQLDNNKDFDVPLIGPEIP